MQQWRCWVRPHLVDHTTARPICEVKQPQASLVLRSVMTREPGVSYSLFSAPMRALGAERRDWEETVRFQSVKPLLTYAKKVTVSVLYWYVRSFRYFRQSLDTTSKEVDFFLFLHPSPCRAPRSHPPTPGYGHTWLKAPHPVRFVKLSNHRLR